MYQTYFPAILMLAVAVIFAIALFTLTSSLGPRNMTREKAIPYESGSDTEGANHLRLSVKFYLTAILFVVFDIESVFLFPFGVAFNRLGIFALVEMVLFILTVFIVYAYVWRRGGLDWD